MVDKALSLGKTMWGGVHGLGENRPKTDQEVGGMQRARGFTWWMSDDLRSVFPRATETTRGKDAVSLEWGSQVVAKERRHEKVVPGHGERVE